MVRVNCHEQEQIKRANQPGIQRNAFVISECHHFILSRMTDPVSILTKASTISRCQHDFTEHRHDITGASTLSWAAVTRVARGQSSARGNPRPRMFWVWQNFRERRAGSVPVVSRMAGEGHPRGIYAGGVAAISQGSLAQRAHPRGGGRSGPARPRRAGRSPRPGVRPLRGRPQANRCNASEIGRAHV